MPDESEIPEKDPPFDRVKLERFVEEYMELEQGLQRPRDVYSFLPGGREGKYQYSLQYFLDPQQPHGFGYKLLEEFLDVVGVGNFNLRKYHIKVEDEVYIGDSDSNGRIDLVICGGSSLENHPEWSVFLS